MKAAEKRNTRLSWRKDKELREVVEEDFLCLGGDLAQAGLVICKYESRSFPVTSSVCCPLSEHISSTPSGRSSLHITPFLPPLGCAEMF